MNEGDGKRSNRCGVGGGGREYGWGCKGREGQGRVEGDHCAKNVGCGVWDEVWEVVNHVGPEAVAPMCVGVVVCGMWHVGRGTNGRAAVGEGAQMFSVGAIWPRGTHNVGS